MITTSGVMVNFSGQPLFEDVNVKFLPGNCYGLIGANGAGKSTFLKVLYGELEPSAGVVSIPSNLRMTRLEQDQFRYDDDVAMDVVLRGHPRLYEVHKEREKLYASADFSEEDGARAAELEMLYADLNGYEAEAEAAILLSGLGVADDEHHRRMGDLEAGQKVRVLLAQALFGKPDILLLDEPTNNLDVHTIAWLEDYLQRLESLVIVVSHDRHFLNNVCTHIADIDFRRLKIYVGNYDFWLQAAELALQQRRDAQKKASDKAKDLKAFIERFSSNASKARQATSRKKLLDQLTLDDLPISTRKYPHIHFNFERECGKKVLILEDLHKSIDGEQLLNGFNLNVLPGDRIAFVGPDGRPRTTLFQILAGELEPDSGTVEWGSTISSAYFPKDNEAYFKDVNLNLIDWLRQYTEDMHLEDVRGFLGRMLFSGEDTKKSVKVLSGGEKVRCMLSRMMQVGANLLILDEPTNHLDLESITALNKGMQAFSENNVILFASHDRELVRTVANRIIELGPNGYLDFHMPFDEYVTSERVAQARRELHGAELGL
ncbi:ABC transporter ATP-binding protein [Lujinxingia litoralis]|uniref:ABC transporter ATP-binding protein n=1 Tax=Lujinxingia litoralis TaxID=2211119 RepID=A0A328C9Q5_9DELT|nr:ATP-binding cassette domain-containing protein [Lujinxingia litoralis]RAL22353.1 ABC transporter ATP-binding protein [Lujinxingia litoralis]